MMQLINLQVIKKWAKRIAIIFSTFYVLGVVLWSWPRTPQCPIEEHSFQGEKLDIEICSGYGSDSGYVGILVYSKEGDFLAWRRGTFAKESPLNYMAIEDTQILYSDDPMNQEDSPADCVLNMPPTWVDWVEARLPGGIPGVNHCGKASYPVIRKARDQWADRTKAAEIEEEMRMREYNAHRQATPPAAEVVEQGPQTGR